MSSPATAQVINSAWIDKLAADPVGTQQRLAEVLRDHIKEHGFNREIIPRREIGPGHPQLQVSLEHDTFTLIEFFEPKSKAFSFNFRGGPRARLVTGPKVAMGFYSIASEKSEITTQELMTYPFPITKMVEENTPLDIEQVEDREFLLNAEAAVQAVQADGNGGSVTTLNATAIANNTVVEWAVVKGERARNASTNDAVARPLERPDIPALKRLHLNQRNRADKILITDHDLTHEIGRAHV